MPVSTTRAELPALFGRVAESCEQAIAAHIEQGRPGLWFQRQVLYSVAALERSSSLGELEDADIRLVRTAASDAAAVCRTERADGAMQAAVAFFEEAADACDGVLGGEFSVDHRQWRRFLFADADLSVSREGRLWRVRGNTGEASGTLLDVALSDAALLTGNRIGELTVQILDWYFGDSAP